ncbi:IS66 family insertion sequence element accessory protein TnpB [Dehalobacter restrictus]
MDRSDLILPEQWNKHQTMVQGKRYCGETYYYWQRRVFEALTARQEPYFAEVPVERRNGSLEVAVTVRIGNAEADIYNSADASIVEVICRALKSC